MYRYALEVLSHSKTSLLKFKRRLRWTYWTKWSWKIDPSQNYFGDNPSSKGKITLHDSVSFGYVPQNYLPANFFSISVREILEMGLPRTSFFRKNRRKTLLEKLSMVGLQESFLEKSFHTFQGTKNKE